MARAQIYRGDPELKQVVLFDNFSGGMNTTDIDEQMGANEFRYLENVELMEQGRVGKRTGFGNLDIEYVSDGERYIGLPLMKNVYNISVLHDKYNNLSEYNYEEFKENKTLHNIVLAAIHYDYGLVLISKIKLSGSFEDGVYSIEVKNESSEELAKAEANESLRIREGFKITGLNINYYDGRAYFMLNQIVENSEEIVSYWYEDANLHVEKFNKINSYRPTPFELTNVGFNTFSGSPHSHMSNAVTSVESIQSVIIMDENDDDIILNSVPLSGKFKLRVYYTGRETLKYDLSIRFYTHNSAHEDGREYLQSSVVINDEEEVGGAFDYNVVVNTAGHSEVYIEVKKTVSTEAPEIDVWSGFTSTDEMVDNFKSAGKFLIEEKIPGYYTIEEGDGENPYSYSTSTLKTYVLRDGVRVGYFEQDMTNIPVARFTENGSTGYTDWKYPKYKDNPAHLMLKNKALEKDMDGNTVGIRDGFPILNMDEASLTEQGLLSGKKYFGFGDTTSNGELFRTYWTRFTRLTEYNELPEFYNVDKNSEEGRLFDEVPTHYFKVNSNKILLVHDDEAELEHDATTYYRYNGGTTGTLNDFTNLNWTTSEDIINFTVRFVIGNTGERPIESLKFNNLKSIIIKDRLVLYGGNTVMYSDIYNRQEDAVGNIQGFTYFPNYNWFSLALGANDSIQKIAYFRGSYMIFTKTSIYRMSGDLHTDEFTITLVSDVVGCVSPDSIRSMNNTLIFLSEDGLYTLKQNYYLDGMENVGKIDSNIQGVIPYGENYESIIYNEQYWLFIKDRNGKLIKVLKQYYNLNLPKGQHPYTIDVYNEGHFYLFRDGIDIYGVKNKELFRKNNEYIDFKPKDEKIFECSYNVKIETPYWSFGYPLHEKKFKNVFLKVNSIKELPIMFDVLVDFGAAISSEHYSTRINSYGEVEYTLERKPTFVTEGVGVLGEMELGKTIIGDAVYQVHKINPATKGKTIKFRFEQGSSSEFSVDAISIVYKLGKMRESR